MKTQPDNSKEAAIAEAINNLASEMRILTFGNASLTKSSPGAIEGLTMAVSDSGSGIASAIGDVATSLSDIADAINKLAEAVVESRGK